MSGLQQGNERREKKAWHQHKTMDPDRDTENHTGLGGLQGARDRPHRAPGKNAKNHRKTEKSEPLQTVLQFLAQMCRKEVNEDMALLKLAPWQKTTDRKGSQQLRQFDIAGNGSIQQHSTKNTDHRDQRHGDQRDPANHGEVVTSFFECASDHDDESTGGRRRASVDHWRLLCSSERPIHLQAGPIGVAWCLFLPGSVG